MSKLAIILANYNDSRFLINWMKKMAPQTPDVEIIVVDDCSTDNSIHLLLELKKKYNFRIVQNLENKGCFNSFIAGCRLTDAEFVAGWSCDDEPEYGYVNKMLKALHDYPHVDLITCNANVIREGKRYERILLPFDAYISPDYMVKMARAGYARMFNVIGLIVRRKFVMDRWEEGGKYMKVNFDAMFAFSSMLTKGFVNLGDNLVLYRSYPNSFGATGRYEDIVKSIWISESIFKRDPELYRRAVASGLWGLKSQIRSQAGLWAFRHAPKWMRMKVYDWLFHYDWRIEKL